MRHLQYDPLNRTPREVVEEFRRRIKSFAASKETAITDARSAADILSRGITLGPEVYRQISCLRRGDLTAHLINGFGLYRDGSQTAHDDISALLVSSSQPAILNDLFDDQRPTDYHPWQTLAYSCMAGLQTRPLVVEGREISLYDIAKHSTRVEIGENGGHELGHLLFAAAHLVPDKGFVLEVDNQKRTLGNLIEMALDVFVAEPQIVVCRGTHLVEGIGAASKLVPGIHMHEEVQEIISRYIEAMVGELFIKRRNVLDLEDIRILGHLAEAAAFAQIHDYEIAAEHHTFISGALVRAAREIGSVDLDLEILLEFCHLRRGATLWAEANGPTPVDRTRYWTDVQYPQIVVRMIPFADE